MSSPSLEPLVGGHPDEVLDKLPDKVLDKALDKALDEEGEPPGS